MRFGRFTGFEATRHEPGIALLQLDQPERLNGMTQALKRDLVETLLQAQMDDSVRVVVFTGSGRAFSAGDHISGRAPPNPDRERLSAPLPPGRGTQIGTYEGLRAPSPPPHLSGGG